MHGLHSTSLVLRIWAGTWLQLFLIYERLPSALRISRKLPWGLGWQCLNNTMQELAVLRQQQLDTGPADGPMVVQEADGQRQHWWWWRLQRQLQQGRWQMNVGWKFKPSMPPMGDAKENRWFGRFSAECIWPAMEEVCSHFVAIKFCMPTCHHFGHRGEFCFFFLPPFFSRFVVVFHGNLICFSGMLF